DAGDLQLAAGQIWRIRVALEGEQLQIGAAVEETDGLLPCIDDSDFPGATADTVAGAVLSEDCRAAVHDLGVWSDCYDRQDSCGLSTATPPARPGTSFWVFLIFVFGLRVVKIR
ncbi:MAG: hypothetical protein JRF33_27880, partial [Deltaproteobacteria bacterium]|nr:hypothetical protein [Deltaproteobacteria bacterium]